jgi:hypothetical protein
MHRVARILGVPSVLLILAAAHALADLPVPTNAPAAAATTTAAARFAVRGGLGMLNGDTTYRIGGFTTLSSGESGTLRFPLSELVFPLDVMTATLEADAALADRWRARLSLTQSLTDDAGTAQDSDWGIWYDEFPWWTDPDSLDVYSESDATLDAFEADLRLTYRLWRRNGLDLAAGAGCRRQAFDFDLENLDQWYPSFNETLGYEVPHEIVPGAVAEYSITYLMPYLYGGADLRVGRRGRVLAGVSAAPWVDIEDEDSHLLRGKSSEGDAEGSAVWIDLEGRYDLTRNWSAALTVAYTAIAGDGDQTQTFDDGSWGVTELEIESTQTAVTALLARMF